jgi:hypothetical protein
MDQKLDRQEDGKGTEMDEMENRDGYMWARTRLLASAIVIAWLMLLALVSVVWKVMGYG